MIPTSTHRCAPRTCGPNKLRNKKASDKKYICQKKLGGFVPKILVETESIYLHNKQNCSQSYQIYGKTADNLISYKTELAGVKLGQSTSNACDNAVFPDGSSNAGFSTQTYRLYSVVLCCKN